MLRVGEMLRHTLADILTRGHIHSDLLSGTPLTVTRVDVSPDLKNATAFVMPLGGAHAPEIEKELNRLAKPIRGELGHSIALKFTPALRFKLDTTFDNVSRIDALLHSEHVQQDLDKKDDDLG
jgi:ribosome-binding factor A